MQNKNELEVYLLYQSNGGKEITFCQIVNSVDVMDQIHYEPSWFWNCSGGLSICLNNYQLIFHSCSFYNLIKVTNFLIHSLYLIKDKSIGRFDSIDFYSDGLTINTLNHEILNLKSVNEKQVSLSFKSSDCNHKRIRGERYFDNIVFEKDKWFEACQIALKEYFDIFLRVLHNSENEDQYTELMKDYFIDWQQI